MLQLATLMRGQVNLESNRGTGTTAYLTLSFAKGAEPRSPTSQGSIDTSVSEEHDPPIILPDSLADVHSHSIRRSGSKNSASGADGGTAKLPQSARKSLQILVVEDNAINQNIIVKFIKKLGFSVKAVWNGMECLDYLLKPDQQRPKPDIILMDCQMPIMDGYEATRQIREDETYINNNFKDVPIIALTASAILGDREKCKAAGMDDYITKPVTKYDLERVLVKWLPLSNPPMKS